MKTSQAFKISLRAIRANKMRSLLTMLGIIIGVAAVILLVSIGSGLKNYVVQQFESMGANTLIIMPGQIGFHGDGEEGGSIPGAGAAASKFTFEHLNQIKNRARTIQTAMAYTENNAKMKYKGETHITQVSGVGPEYQQVRNQYVTSGAFFSQAHYNAAKRVAVLGKTTAEELFGGLNPIGKRITISDQHYLVLGILEEKGSLGGIDMDDQAFIPATTALKQFDMEYIQSFMVQAKNRQLIPQAKAEVERILLKSFEEDDFSILDTKDLLNTISQVLNVLTLALGGIAAISLVVGGIGIMNIMLVSVTERTREVGLRKAVGATARDIMLQFLIEAVFLSLVGGLLGIGLGIAGSLALSNLIKTSITNWSILIAFSVSALVGIVFGVAPAAKAARLDPINALRYE